MPRLNKFTFNIYTNVDRYVEIAFSSNEDIQRSFNRKEYGPVASHIETFARENERMCHMSSLPYEFKSRCHIYSLPYQFKYFHLLNNFFQGGTFDNVLFLLMTDCCAFEHNFFKIISQSFPRLKELFIVNKEPQKNKQRKTPIIAFSHLIYLDLCGAHADYVEQFLVNSYCHLPCLFILGVNFYSLLSVTKYFKNDLTRLTCSKLKHLLLGREIIRTERFHKYFPSL